MDLAARPARSGISHPPEVVLLPQPEDARRVHPDLVTPDRESLLVAGHGRRAVEDRDPQAIDRNAVHLGEQLPAPGDRVTLEVVAEGEVAQHLEKGLVARRAPHLLEVVVFSGDAQALLRRRRADVLPLLAPREHVLELVHPRVREQEGRVVREDEG